MTPRHPRDLSDTDREMIALGAEIERERHDTPLVTSSESSERMEKLILEHEKECWGKDGPLGQIQKDVNDIKAWGKAISIGLIALQVYSAYKSFTAPKQQPIQIVIPKQEHASLETNGSGIASALP